MEGSVRLHIRRSGQDVDCLIELVADDARHFEVEAKPGGNNVHGLVITVRSLPPSQGFQRDSELAAGEAVHLRSVDRLDRHISGVNVGNELRPFSVIGHQQPPCIFERRYDQAARRPESSEDGA